MKVLAGIRRYRLGRLLAGSAVVAYASIAILAKPPDQIEAFPFFNWSLFSYSSDHKLDRTLLIRSVDGHTFAKPKLIYDPQSGIALDSGKGPRLNKMLDKWVYTIRHHNVQESERLHSVVDNTYLSNVKTADYDLVVIRYDPIKRLRTGTIDSIEVIASFRKGAR